MWGNILKIVAWFTDLAPNIGKWWRKQRREAVVKKVEKIVASPDVSDDARLLDEIAAIVERRKKSS